MVQLRRKGKLNEQLGVVLSSLGAMIITMKREEKRKEDATGC